MSASITLFRVHRTGVRRASRIAAAALWLAVSGCAGRAASPPPAPLPLGVAAGEVDAHSAVIWSRGSGPGVMRVELMGSPDGDRPETVLAAANDYTGQVILTGLVPATRYRYRVTVESSDGTVAAGSGRFRTAPGPDTAAPVRFLFGGDLAGQNVCRDARRGFPIFSAIESVDADFFVALGDMIYADALCEPTGAYGNDQVAGDFGLATRLADFHAHWRYSYADPGLRRLRERMGYYGVWDDHEVVNDFAPGHSRLGGAGPQLLPLGLAAFLDYNPLTPPPGDPARLYRRFRWGAHAEIFFLDTRQYRDPKGQPDTQPVPKTMLGEAQRRWLVRAVTGSTATWKFIVTSAPLSVPTGWPPQDGRDGWANGGGDTGYERELLSVLRKLRDGGSRNLVWLSADVHFATGIALRPFPDDEDFVVYDLVSGPLNAGLFANREMDDTLHPVRLFFHGPDDWRQVSGFDEALGWMNVGLVSLDREGVLAYDVYDGHGRAVIRRIIRPNCSGASADCVQLR